MNRRNASRGPTEIRRHAWLRLLAVAAALVVVSSARAEGVVSTLTEEALRSAVAGGGRVSFAASGTITLTSPLVIGANTTIGGAGFTVRLSGRGSNSVIHAGADLTLLDLTLADGQAANGGGLFIEPAAVVLASNCIFTANMAVGTNGVAGTNGADSSSVGKNGTAGGSGTPGLGGAIFNQGQLTLLACQFLTNKAAGGTGAAGGAGGAGDFEGGDGGRGGNGGAALGGAIHSTGALVASNCTFAGNTVAGGNAAAGGAAGNGPFPGHRGHGGAGGAGNGAALHAVGPATVVNCTFLANQGTGGNSALSGQESNGNGRTAAAGADALGGGLWCGGLCSVTNSTFSANSVVGGNGGAGGDAGATGLQGGDGGRGGYGMGGSVCNAGTLRLVNCTLVGGNSLGGLGGLGGDGPYLGGVGSDAPPRGGNVANSSGTIVLKNSILAYPASGTNSYTVTNVVSVVTNYPTEIVVVSASTFALVSLQCGTLNYPNLACYTNIVFTNGNTVSSNLFLLTNSPCLPDNFPTNCLTNIVFTNVVVSNYTVTTWVTNVVGVTNISAGFNAHGVITDASHNLSSDASPAFGVLSRNCLDPKLGVLADNGGPAKTFALNIGSPALNSGDDAAALPFDQRGTARPTGGGCDIGAVEMGGPVIQTHPQSQAVANGASVQFSVAASGEIAPSYQWRFNGVNLANATTTQLRLTNVQPTDAGDYTVFVTNPFGAATSQVATLAVTVRPQITQPSLLGDRQLAFTFTTRAGRLYFVEYKDALTNKPWIRLGTNAGTGGPLTHFASVTNASSRFFRIVEQ